MTQPDSGQPDAQVVRIDASTDVDAGGNTGADAGRDSGADGSIADGGMDPSPCAIDDGRCIFRHDTFGDEQQWTDLLRLNELVETLSPRAALGVGLKVDSEAVPPEVLAAADLDDPATTIALLSLNAVVGVRATIEDGHVASIGVACALCHSDVDDSVMPGVGRRLDGWPNRDLDTGAIIPSYVSLQTALHRHGLIEQIPEVVYVVSLARTQKMKTKVGAFSIHHVAPEVFGGFEETERCAKVATAEKSLFDFAYLSSGRSRLFTNLPELELPRGFKRKELARWLAKIPSERSRTLTSRKLDELLAKAGVA